MNVPNDRMVDRNQWIRGESLQETAVRVAAILAAPPRAMPVTPAEYRDPDAPPGWYDTPDMAAFWR